MVGWLVRGEGWGWGWCRWWGECIVSGRREGEAEEGVRVEVGPTLDPQGTGPRSGLVTSEG